MDPKLSPGLPQFVKIKIMKTKRLIKFPGRRAFFEINVFFDFLCRLPLFGMLSLPVYLCIMIFVYFWDWRSVRKTKAVVRVAMAVETAVAAVAMAVVTTAAVTMVVVAMAVVAMAAVATVAAAVASNEDVVEGA